MWLGVGMALVALVYLVVRGPLAVRAEGQIEIDVAEPARHGQRGRAGT